MERVKICVVGVGYLGEHHARILSSMDDVCLVGVVDTKPGHAETIAQKYGCKAYTELKDIIDQVDAAVVAVPTVYHHDVTMELFQAGKDVLLEKPIAIDMGQADAMVDMASQSGAVFQVGHLERFNGAILKLADYLNEPRFVESHRLGPFAARGTDVDVVLDLMIHDIDVLLSLVKSKVSEVRSVGVPVISHNVDIANVRLEFENGCVANVTASRASMTKMRKMRIFQNDAYLSLDYSTQELKVLKKSGRKILAEDVSITKVEPLRAELVSFLAAVRDRARPIVSGQDARDALEVALVIKEKSMIH